jgi:hypothetical protein
MENLKYLLPVIGGAIFAGGYQVSRIDELFGLIKKSHAEEQSIKEIIFDMHGRICSMEVILREMNQKRK